MSVRVLRPAIVLTTAIAVLLAALAAYAYYGIGTSDADSTYNPDTDVAMCNRLPATFPGPADADLAGDPACTDDLTAGANTDFTTVLTEASGDLNFSNVTTFAPNGMTINQLAETNPAIKVGGLRSATTLGIINANCSTSLTVDFVFYNVALPDDTGNPRNSTNIAFPRPVGSSDRFGGWQVGSEPAPAGGTNPIGGSGRADGASIAIQNYPSYLLDLFDPTFTPGVGDSNPGDELIPRAVYGGLTNVAGSATPLYFAQFDDGALTALPEPFASMAAAAGQPSVSVLTDPTAVAGSPSTISDFCTPLTVTTMLLGDPPGAGTRAVTPSGTGLFVQYNASLRDLDQDGFENAIDTCPDTVSPDPRSLGGGNDSDSDGIPNVCDTNSPNASGVDVDGDGFQNRQDVCPQVNDTNDESAEYSAGPSADKGTRNDGIGSACDSEMGVVAVTQNGVAISITASDSVANGRFHIVQNIVAKCFGGTDADGDGYCAPGGSGDNADSGACASTSPPSCAVRHTSYSGSHPGLAMDSDSDGFSDVLETYMGTDATKSCAATPVPPSTAGGANDETIDNWPVDFDDNRLVSIADVLKLNTPVFGSVTNDAIYPIDGRPGERHDLNGDGIISIADILNFSAAFGARCGQGTVGQPGPFVQQ